MARVKRGIVRRRKTRKVLKLAKGFYGARSKQYRTAKVAVMKALSYAYRDRRARKRDMRRLWNIRINAACREFGTTYSRFINGLDKAGIVINRKMLALIAQSDIATFEELVKASQKQA